MRSLHERPTIPNRVTISMNNKITILVSFLCLSCLIFIGWYSSPSMNSSDETENKLAGMTKLDNDQNIKLNSNIVATPTTDSLSKKTQYQIDSSVPVIEDYISQSDLKKLPEGAQQALAQLPRSATTESGGVESIPLEKMPPAIQFAIQEAEQAQLNSEQYRKAQLERSLALSHEKEQRKSQTNQELLTQSMPPQIQKIIKPEEPMERVQEGGY